MRRQRAGDRTVAMDAEDAALACGHGQRRSQLTAAAEAHHVRREGPRRVDYCARAKRLPVPACLG